MLLVKINNKKNNRMVTRTPFFFFLKKKSFKNLKLLIKSSKSSMLKKKFRSFNYIISCKKSQKTVFYDKNSYFTETSDASFIECSYNFNKSTDKSLQSTYNSNSVYYFSYFYKYLADFNLIGRVFFNAYSIYNGDLLYRSSGGCFMCVNSLSSVFKYIKIRLPSGFLKKIDILSVGSLGRGIGIFNNYKYLGKFKYSFKKKSVRGIAMNPVDHPNGGRSNTKRPFMNLYNQIAKVGK